jgi:hypothetical protein
MKMYIPLDIKRNKKYGSNYWEGLSLKLNRRVRLFSDLEYDHWILVETDPNIKLFCEQPFSIKMYFEGELYESIPDMWVMKNDGTEFLIEVKYTSELIFDDPKNSPTIKKIRAYKLWCKMNNFKYLLRTEHNIRRNPIYLQNMKTIQSFIKGYHPPSESEKLEFINLIQNKKLKLFEIEQYFSQLSKDRIRGILSWLIYQGFIFANLDKMLIHNQTEVWM